MFIRFVINDRDPDSGKRQGLFQALVELEENDELEDYEARQSRELINWFNKNLKEPSSLARSKKYHAKKVAISWFKHQAVVHIRKMRELVAILENHGVSVEVVQTERPGYIVYEDAFQVAAEPFKDTNT